jgi:hypothetical protein
MEINKSSVRVGLFIKIITPEYSEYYYQNFSTEDVIESGKTYNFVPIDFTPPARNLNLDNVSATVILPNLPDIRQAVEQNDGFRDAIVESKCMFPDNLNISPYAYDLMVVSGSKVSGMSIEISLRSPFSAVTGRFPSTFWTTGRSAVGLNIVGFVPEVPITSNVNLR